METEEIAFNLVLHSGNARSNVMDSLKCARNYNFNEAKELLKEADNELEKAHKIQTEVLQKEASGENAEPSLLFIHAQDHLMTAMLARDLSDEIINLREGQKNH